MIRKLLLPVFLVISFLGYAFAPIALNADNIKLYAQSSPDFIQERNKLFESVKRSASERDERSIFIKNINPFIDVVIAYGAYKYDGEVGLEYHTAPEITNINIKLDRVIVVLSVIIAFAITYNKLGKFENKESSTPIISTSEENQSIAVLEREVERAKERSAAIFERATYILAGGVLMAFLGVAVFYLSITEKLFSNDQSYYWINILRSTGILTTIEAIAWFLLRQYRNNLDDFKKYNEIYIQRANFLIALYIIKQPEIRKEEFYFASSLIKQKYSDNLSLGETTEALERAKIEHESIQQKTRSHPEDEQ